SSIRLVIAQRLVSRLSDSKEEYEPDEAEKKYLREKLAGVKDFNPDNIKLYKPVPTDEDPFGYRGRLVLMEQLIVSEEISKFIRGDVEDINTSEIEKVAVEKGMLTLEQKGLLAALRGETTLEEVSRVI
ncbi:hypothetical protein IJG10_01925, partial [Candidatus Saccharibacteria bacterium]|nr:hypothetical protein [Candidatus Saccharibacteria bacterium]